MRTMVIWFPDWPVVAQFSDQSASTPAAIMQSGQVLACSAAARTQGVRRGMRQRDAQATCPELVVRDHQPEVDARTFDAVIDLIESVLPRVALMRPGLCAVAVPQRYYGGETEAAAVLAEQLVTHGIWDVRCGIADDLFAAEQAARQATPQDSCVVPPGQSAAFLAPLSVDVLDDEALISVLHRLGIRRLADFAALSHADVHTRFGPHGALLHALASGRDSRPLARRTMPPEFTGQLQFEPPLHRIDVVTFSSRTMIDGLVGRLADHGLVATSVGIDIESEQSVVSHRLWRHSRWFSAADLLDRLRWQLQGAASKQQISAPIDGVRISPELVEPLADHADGLFGGGPQDHVIRGVARVQSMVGPEAVRSVHLQGGRSPVDRQLTASWGDEPQLVRAPDQPWPGRIPDPAPAVVFAQPLDAAVLAADGRPVTVSHRGAVRGVPTRFRASPDVALQPISSWAGPWPVDEQWWNEAAARQVARFQIVGIDGTAWLMFVENGRWQTEARYD